MGTGRHSVLGKRDLVADIHPPTPKRQRYESVDGIHDDDANPRQQTKYPADTASTPNTPRSPTSTTATSITNAREKKFKCIYPDCGKAFVRPCRLDEHLRSHTNTRPFPCTFAPCNKTFLRQSHLDHHVKSAHTKVREHICAWPGCGKGFVSKTRLRHHDAVHQGENKYRCTDFGECHQVFRKHSTLQRHIDKDHLNIESYRCTQIDQETNQPCLQRFKTPSKLTTHKHNRHTTQAHSCSLCSNNTTDVQPIVFPTYADLQAHIKTAHPPICTICSTPCTSNADLTRHNHLHHPEITSTTTTTKKPYIHHCPHPDCNKSFNKANNLKTHLTNVHEKTHRFKCGSTDLSQSRSLEGWSNVAGCGRAFSAKQSLEQHIRRAHLDTTVHPVRRARKAHPSTNVTTLSKLTGEGYAEESGRNIPCSREGCVHRFYRAYDLKVHLDTFHGLEDFEIEADVAEVEALRGGVFWLGGGDGDGYGYGYGGADAAGNNDDGDGFVVMKEGDLAALAGAAGEAVDPMLA